MTAAVAHFCCSVNFSFLLDICDMSFLSTSNQSTCNTCEKDLFPITKYKKPCLDLREIKERDSHSDKEREYYNCFKN